MVSTSILYGFDVYFIWFRRPFHMLSTLILQRAEVHFRKCRCLPQKVRHFPLQSADVCMAKSGGLYTFLLPAGNGISAWGAPCGKGREHPSRRARLRVREDYSLTLRTATDPKRRRMPASTSIIGWSDAPLAAWGRYLRMMPPKTAATICGRQMVQLKSPR